MYFIFKNSQKLRKHKYVLNEKKIAHIWQQRNSTNAATIAPLAAGYQPKQVEADKWQQICDTTSSKDNGQCKRGVFRMLLPPPNVTGDLHLGHALMATVQDVICRQRRQLGYEVQWIPGTDHAGIATQVVVEKRLMKSRGLSRHQLGREKFLQEVWQWKREKGGGIVEDLRRLGCTLSWDKEYFTMDERQADAVNSAFVQLFEQGLIKRERSLVNWSCSLESAISDIEVESLELKGPTELAVPGYAQNIKFGRIYDIAYTVCDSDNEQIIVSTTRPETLLGDVAVAVHPSDERYSKYRHMNDVQLWHPFRREPIPLVFDVSVEPEFGSGAVKITPAHDRDDYELAQRHLLSPIQVFTEQGTICKEFGEFAALPRFEARERILAALSEQQLLGDIKDHAMVLPICSRSKDIIEYMLRPQWFLHCQPMADAALSAVNSGRLQLLPTQHESEWTRWLTQCNDWCISRQLWWGHQVPAYLAQDEQGNECWVAASNETEAWQKAAVALKATPLRLQRDADVLDTWFSSALLPFAVHGWPDAKYKQNYPLDLMETGHDILFFWVARMVMLGLQLTGEAPFKQVLLNGIVCDAHGRKMSKSLGNVVTPQQVVQGASKESLESELQKSFDAGILSTNELQKSLQGLQKMFPHGIQECGTDALRFTLCSHNIKSHFINFDVTACYTNKLFLNKIWQATRFTLNAAEKLQMPLMQIESMNHVELSTWDKWILSRLASTLKICAQSFENYNLHAATAALKQFFYSNLCDVYLETTKADINAANAQGYIHCATLATCLSWALQAMSPFTPFIAAELLQYLPQNIELNLSKQSNPALEQEIADVLEICQSIRQLKSRNKLSKKHAPIVHLFAQTSAALAVLEPHLAAIKVLTLTHAVELHEAAQQQQMHLDFHSTAGHLCAFGLTTNDLFKPTTDAAQSTNTLNKKKLLKLQTELEGYRLRIENEGFRKSASEQVQRKHLERIIQLEVEIENIKSMAN